MSTHDTKYIELEEGERELLHNALEILSPDSPDASESLELLTQNILDSTLEPGSLDMEFTEQEVELAISALEIIEPDDFEAQDMATELEERFREVHNEMSSSSLSM